MLTSKIAILAAVAMLGACASSADPVEVEAARIKAEQRANAEAVATCKSLGETSNSECIRRITSARLGNNSALKQLLGVQ